MNIGIIGAGKLGCDLLLQVSCFYSLGLKRCDVERQRQSLWGKAEGRSVVGSTGEAGVSGRSEAGAENEINSTLKTSLLSSRFRLVRDVI